MKIPVKGRSSQVEEESPELDKKPLILRSLTQDLKLEISHVKPAEIANSSLPKVVKMESVDEK